MNLPDKQSYPAPADAEPQSSNLPLKQVVERLQSENAELRQNRDMAFRYIRDKVNQLLLLMGTVPLKPEELDDNSLIAMDPIGIVSESFDQVLKHLQETNTQLREARNEIRALFDSAGAAMMVVDIKKGIQDFNHKMKQVFFEGLSDREILGMPCSQVICAGEPDQANCTLSMVLTTGKTFRHSGWMCKGRHFDVTGVPLRDSHGKIYQALLSYADITYLINIQKALEESEERYRDLFESASDLIISANLDGTLQYANKGWCDTIGCSRKDVSRMDFLDVVHPDDRERCKARIANAVRDGLPFRIDTRLLSRRGGEISVEGMVSFRLENSKPVSLRGIFRDVTETRKLQGELMKAQKLEALGLLAGGIAHDFNNLLTAITGNLSLIASFITEKDHIHQFVNDAENASNHARELTQQLLTFAKGGAPVKSVASIGTLVRESVQLALHGSNVSCNLSIPEKLMPVKADPGQINQVIQNLVINAIQAMPNGGHMEVACRDRLLGDSGPLPVKPGSYVEVLVRDQGTGISPEIMDRVFDPFFTTKESGSGLGLATCYSIMKKHGGHISVDSAPGTGSMFSVLIPASQEKKPLEDSTQPRIKPAKGKILIMDDQELVRRVASKILEEVGYQVELAAEGATAVDMYRRALEAGEPYTLVILDLTVVGGMGGYETLCNLKEMDPQVKAIVSSGYSNDPIMADYRNHGFQGIVGKPFNFKKLVASVQSLE